jgi:hypothetical protein
MTLTGSRAFGETVAVLSQNIGVANRYCTKALRDNTADRQIAAGFRVAVVADHITVLAYPASLGVSELQ